MAKYLNDGKVIEVKGARFNVNYLKSTRKSKVLKELYSSDADILEEAFNEVNGIKPETKKASPKEDKSKPDKKKKG